MERCILVTIDNLQLEIRRYDDIYGKLHYKKYRLYEKDMTQIFQQVKRFIEKYTHRYGGVYCAVYIVMKNLRVIRREFEIPSCSGHVFKNIIKNHHLSVLGEEVNDYKFFYIMNKKDTDNKNFHGQILGIDKNILEAFENMKKTTKIKFKKIIPYEEYIANQISSNEEKGALVFYDDQSGICGMYIRGNICWRAVKINSHFALQQLNHHINNMEENKDGINSYIVESDTLTLEKLKTYNSDIDWRVSISDNTECALQRHNIKRIKLWFKLVKIIHEKNQFITASKLIHYVSLVSILIGLVYIQQSSKSILETMTKHIDVKAALDDDRLNNVYDMRYEDAKNYDKSQAVKQLQYNIYEEKEFARSVCEWIRKQSPNVKFDALTMNEKIKSFKIDCIEKDTVKFLEMVTKMKEEFVDYDIMHHIQKSNGQSEIYTVTVTKVQPVLSVADED
ncbi:MAG: hypothetical protein ACRCSG_08250 [Cellulosilyticaceae bacterium]